MAAKKSYSYEAIKARSKVRPRVHSRKRETHNARKFEFDNYSLSNSELTIELFKLKKQIKKLKRQVKALEGEK